MHAEIWVYQTNDTEKTIGDELERIAEHIHDEFPMIKWVVNMLNPGGPSIDIWEFLGNDQDYLTMICKWTTAHFPRTDYTVVTD